MSEQTPPVPHFNVHTTEFEPLPEYGGGQAILYRSPDGRRLAGSFKESGQHDMVMPFDEFIYVVGGTMRVTVDGSAPLDLAAGDACYLKAGQHVNFEQSDDFHDVTVLVSEDEISF